MDNSVGRTGQNEKEFIELEKALRTLCNEGFLNKIECRIIASRELHARKVALYDKLTSKYKQNPMDVLQMFKILTSGTQEEADANAELSNFDVNEEINENLLNTSGKNALLNNTAPIRELDARKIALYDIITSKYKQDPMSVLEILEILTFEIQEETGPSTELSNFDVNQEEIIGNGLNTSVKNPLLINTVIHNALKYLPLKDIKKCRLVNQQWNTTAEPYLRERGLIHFKPEILKPLDFIHAQQFSLPDLPFTEFKFSRARWYPSEMQQFFDKWGHNIKSVEFRGKLVGTTDDYHDITSWITKATNLNKLIMICGPLHVPSEGLGIALDALAEVESITLANCAILCFGEGNSRLMAPREILLQEVDFANEGQLINSVCFNDYIDFSRCFKIDIRNKSFIGRHFEIERNKSFDMSSVVLNAKSVFFYGISVENWGGARGKVDSLSLYDVDLIERNNLEIKELTVYSGTVDMAVIPHTIEKLRFPGRVVMIDGNSLQLPNLKFFSMIDVSQWDLNVISRFACCAKVKIELMGSTSDASESALNLNVGHIPKSVKILKIRNVKINTSGLLKRQLETLIIEHSNFENFFDSVTEMLSKKILTLNVLVISCLDVTNLNTFDIFRFVKSNMEKVEIIEKLVIGVVGNVGLNKNRKFKGSLLSFFVNEESNYYQFTNQVGESITREEFEAFINIGH